MAAVTPRPGAPPASTSPTSRGGRAPAVVLRPRPCGTSSRCSCSGAGYGGQLATMISDITIGAGALIVGGGMVFVIFSMSFFTGTEVGLQGLQGPRADRRAGLHRPGRQLRQHPRDHADHRRGGLRRPGRRGLHGRVGRHAHLRRDRRARGHVGADARVPRVPPASSPRFVCIIPLYLFSLFASFFATEIVTTSSSGCRPASTTTTSTCTCRRSTSSTAWPRPACSPSSSR